MPLRKAQSANHWPWIKPSHAGAFAAVSFLGVPALLFWALQRPGNRKACEKQVAMIAQKVVDANQTKKHWSGFIPLPDARTPTLRTTLRNHYPS